MFQFKTFPLHNQGPLWFIVTHPRMLYEKKKYCVKSTLSGGPAIFVAREKNICCSKKIFVARRKKIVARGKKIVFRKQYLWLEKKILVAQFLWDLKFWFGGDAEMRMEPICKIMSQGAALCRKIAPKRSFLTRLHPKGAHFKILHRLLISKTLNWQQRTHRNQSLSRNWGGKLLRKCYLHTESDDITAELNVGTKNFGGK